jgi:hypothetical protein
MQQQVELHEQEMYLDDQINNLEAVNKKIAKLLVEKEELTASIISLIGHAHEGERTYEHGEWQIKARTPFIYSLNTKMYRSGEVFLDDFFNPIEESISYKVNREKAEEYMQTAPSSARDALLKLITKKEGKKSVVLTAKGR